MSTVIRTAIRAFSAAVQAHGAHFGPSCRFDQALKSERSAIGASGVVSIVAV